MLNYQRSSNATVPHTRSYSRFTHYEIQAQLVQSK
jgi:hypothetical protein